MQNDSDFIDELIQIGKSETAIAEAGKAVSRIAPSYGTVWPHNCCALFLSEILNRAGVPIGHEPSAGRLAYKLGGTLNSRQWVHLPVGQQQAGDIGVCFDADPSIPGADHIYLVVKRVDADKSLISDNQKPFPHVRSASGRNVGEGSKTATDYFLRAPGYTPEGADLPTTTSWAAQTAELNTPTLATGSSDDATAIIEYARTAPFSRFVWSHGQGTMPAGYVKGMALAYARMLCKLRDSEPSARAMAVANRNDDTDALTWYGPAYARLGLDNQPAGEATLRHTFNLLIGLGVHESSGRYYCGRDMSAHFSTADSAEAGLFQTSFGAHRNHSEMSNVYTTYRGSKDFLDVFKEGAGRADPGNLKNWGEGEGVNFQELTKSCPAFAAEYAALCLRYGRSEFGTIKRRVIEITLDCDRFLKGVEDIVNEREIKAI